MKYYTNDENRDLIEITDEADLFVAMLADTAIELTDMQFKAVTEINTLVKEIDPSAQTDGVQHAIFVKNFGIDTNWSFWTHGRIVNCLSPTGRRIWLEVI